MLRNHANRGMVLYASSLITNKRNVATNAPRKPLFDKILIANRGEIAVRVAKTARKLGVKTVAVYSEADKNAMHVQMADEAYLIGPPPSSESYLRADKIIQVAEQSGAQAIHPGYGFLSENATFAAQVTKAGLAFIGPPVDAIIAMGSKSASKVIMTTARVPVVPGYHGEDQSVENLKKQADLIGYPVLIKAIMGGGGKGMRIVEMPEDFEAMLESSRREAQKSFGDTKVLVEKYLVRPRHVEVQIFADTLGNAVYLFERDCSVQRRHQKILEEAPAPGLTQALRDDLGNKAVAAARAVKYVGAGTVEFILDTDTNKFYFMEMNTRLQVEHPVTEMVTGTDLVHWQLEVAAGNSLPMNQRQLALNGHAFEARIYAENPNNNFLPDVGPLLHLRTPSPSASIRVETGVRQGDAVSVYYDPMISKLVVHGEDRTAALRVLRKALGEFEVVGLKTNVEFLKALAKNQGFIDGDVETGFIKKREKSLFPEPVPLPPLVIAQAALSILMKEVKASHKEAKLSQDCYSPWNQAGFRLNHLMTRTMTLQDDNRPCTITIEYIHENTLSMTVQDTTGAVTKYDNVTINWNAMEVLFEESATVEVVADIGGRKLRGNCIWEGAFGQNCHVFQDGTKYTVSKALPIHISQSSQIGEAGDLRTPMPCKIASINVKVGQKVEKGQTLIILEAMKMEHTMKAPEAGVVKKIYYHVGDLVAGHSQDVRALASSMNVIYSASRDSSVITWTRPTTSSNQWDSVNHIKTHQKFVNAIAIIPPSKTHPQGLVVSGGQDKVIHVSDPLIPASEPTYMLAGHSENVCALTVAANGDIISGSWDKTTRVWRNWNLLYTLEGHEASVWAVLSVADDQVLTGSADKKIKLWKSGRSAHTYSGHTDAVRGLAWLSQADSFVSAANDASLRIWSIRGQCLKELHGHTAFVYSVSVLPSGEIVSSGEDRTVRVWKDGELTQTIPHPCTSVWTVTALPDGDIASGGSDSLIRVFTRHGEAVADANTITEFNEAVAHQAIPSNQVGDVDKNKLPGLEALSRPGKKDGDVVMVRNGNVVEAHQWEQSASKWSKVGEVVDAIGSERKQIFAGREYDYVFDVDIGDGRPPLKLPYNASENPYWAAQEFIEKNDLSQGFLDQVANFIVQNAKGVSLGSGDPGARSDPFTGGGRYVPGGSSQPPTPSYSAPAPKSAPASSSLIPQREYLSFKAANVPAILTRIQQFNNELSSTPDAHLDASSASVLVEICKALESAASSPISLTGAQIRLVCKLAFGWPSAKKFPAIDLLRLCLAYSPQPVLNDGAAFLAQVLAITPLGSHLAKEDETNLMLILRVISNMYLHPAGRKVMGDMRLDVFSKIRESWRGSANRNLRLAFATVLLNASIHVTQFPDESWAIDTVALILEFLIAENDSESTMRGLAALGTLCYNSVEARAAAQALEAPSQIGQLTVRSAGNDEAKLREISGAVTSIISS
ncbi:hypothetical protein SeMB42_g04279 [Synchytrium endobioticum]|uniref:Acetyl-CoA carboxylase n=1 Tax=Synchytrium endobioticum TaxID=286115 RepID=A0A507CPN9_9FUNG|nr:hypothetical protein SeLEV6574_g06251 [Synchytrium endobioticum]TPX44610.1 hypothetical protein SeMB42_g04279 [Synchytrium endobioticum]